MTIELKEYYTVHHLDLEALIKKALDIDYEILPYEEVGGDNCYLVQRIEDRVWCDYEKETLTKLCEGKPARFAIGTIMQAMYRGGYINAGEYLIDCSH
ncbi:hypothetical protein VPHD51_0178 [Vibrio phage D51]